jgi:hypothetical protein
VRSGGVSEKRKASAETQRILRNAERKKREKRKEKRFNREHRGHGVHRGEKNLAGLERGEALPYWRSKLRHYNGVSGRRMFAL